ncbi:MAG: oligosaccharide flippase family protein [Rickettsiaceae bacterium]|nr:oligosaccharide flippase family protein [Rickettsiaceae bacterium]
MDLGNYNKNVVSSLVCKASTLLYQIIAVPYCIQNVSRENFGIYSSILALNSMILLTEFGFGPIISKIAANANSSNDSQALRQLFTNVAVSAVVISSALSVLFTIFFISYSSDLLKYDFAKHLVIIIAIISVVQSTFVAIYKIQLGIDKIYYYNSCATLGNILSALYLIITTYLSPSVINLAYALVINVISINFTNYIILRKSNKDITIDINLISKNYYLKILKFGIGLSICYSEAHIIRELFKISNVNYISSDNLAKYSILVHLFCLIYGVVTSMISPLLPITIKYRDDKIKLRKLLSRLMIAISFFSLTLFLLFIAFHNSILNFIYGPNYFLNDYSAFWFSVYTIVQLIQCILLLFLLTLVETKKFYYFFIINLISTSSLLYLFKVDSLHTVFSLMALSSILFIIIPSILIINKHIK